MKDQILLLITGIVVAAGSWAVIHMTGQYWFYFLYAMLAVSIYLFVRKWIKKRGGREDDGERH